VSPVRARRMNQIVEHRSRAVGRAEIDTACHARRTVAAAELLARARDEWQAAMSLPSSSRCSSADLMEAHEYRLGMRRRMEALETQERQARAGEEASRQALRHARSALKKVETWRDRITQAAAAGDRLLEQRASDELAARIMRTA
jgi:flagellar biosynthesis chaperone FliJ